MINLILIQSLFFFFIWMCFPRFAENEIKRRKYLCQKMTFIKAENWLKKLIVLDYLARGNLFVILLAMVIDAFIWGDWGFLVYTMSISIGSFFGLAFCLDKWYGDRTIN